MHGLFGSQKVRELLLSFMIPSCLFGGIAAILIATTSSLNGMPILSLPYFGYHSAIVIFALVLLTSGTLVIGCVTLCYIKPIWKAIRAKFTKTTA